RLAGGQQFAGAGESRHLEIASADGPEQVIGGDDHLRSGLARGGTAHRGESDEESGHPSAAELGCGGHACHDGTRCPSASAGDSAAVVRERTSSMAQNTCSGVAGEARRTEEPGAPKAATASRRASRTEKASMCGGSPTAFEP